MAASPSDVSVPILTKPALVSDLAHAEQDADYVWARPALLARTFRSAELRAGLRTRDARRGNVFD